MQHKPQFVHSDDPCAASVAIGLLGEAGGLESLVKRSHHPTA
jgi:hypothetical protein